MTPPTETPTLAERIERLTEAVGKMTAGPFRDDGRFVLKPGPAYDLTPVVFGLVSSQANNENDAAGIVALRNSALPIIAALTAENAKLARELAEAKRMVECFAKECNEINGTVGRSPLESLLHVKNGFTNKCADLAVAEHQLAEAKRLNVRTADAGGVVIGELRQQLAEAVKERDKLAVFKKWVHDYLDGKGIPHHPPGTHGAEGCRIGDRMDYLFAEFAAWKDRAEIAEGIEDGEVISTLRGVCRDYKRMNDELEQQLAALRDALGTAHRRAEEYEQKHAAALSRERGLRAAYKNLTEVAEETVTFLSSKVCLAQTDHESPPEPADRESYEFDEAARILAVAARAALASGEAAPNPPATQEPR